MSLKTLDDGGGRIPIYENLEWWSHTHMRAPLLGVVVVVVVVMILPQMDVVDCGLVCTIVDWYYWYSEQHEMVRIPTPPSITQK